MLGSPICQAVCWDKIGILFIIAQLISSLFLPCCIMGWYPCQVSIDIIWFVSTRIAATAWLWVTIHRLSGLRDRKGSPKICSELEVITFQFAKTDSSGLTDHCLLFWCVYVSGQIIATSHDLTPKGSWEREIPLFRGNLYRLLKSYNSARCLFHHQWSVNPDEIDC